ncbi:MAG: 16S rRNA (uracil(1498)-N(3))-methyltransferase [Anaerolineae bacterium]|nr:16S rRNA (uracil(1498)-N(3))-methyltransferase [Anaerolineae bacterium]
MTTPRFFVPPEWLQGEQVVLKGPVYHQVHRVLRLEPGDDVILLDNSGWESVVRLREMAPEEGRGEVISRRLAMAEPKTKITLYQAVLKGRRFEFALQKGTELGLVEFVPIVTDRCIVADLDAAARKERRWRKILQEAAEQSGRGRIPHLRPALLFPRACERVRRTGGLSLLLWEGGGSVSLRALLGGEAQAVEALQALLAEMKTAPPEVPAPIAGSTRQRPFSVNLFVGPEGGFTEGEVALARQYGILPVTLGPRILRAETAGLVAASAILYALGDLE